MSSSARKSAGGSAKKKKKSFAPAAPVDDLDSMDVDALSEELRQQQMRLQEMRRNRNYYQLEKDSVQQFYDIVQDEVGKTEAHLRNIEAQMERMQDTHRNDVRIYLQKVVH